MSDNALDKFTDKENAPAFYKPEEVIKLETWLNRAAVATVVMTIISGFLAFPTSYHTFTLAAPSDAPLNIGIASLVILALILGAAFQSIISYFSLKALAFILKILMEMEFKARGAK
jgi:membrane-bound acyltransferase YfiQ involved in biofilm formation